MYLDIAGSGVDVKLVMPGPIDTEIWDIPGNEPALIDIEKVPAADCAAGIADAMAGDGFEYYVPPVYPGGIGAKDLALAKVQDCDNYLRRHGRHGPRPPQGLTTAQIPNARTVDSSHGRSRALQVEARIPRSGEGEPIGEAEAGEVAAGGEAGAARRRGRRARRARRSPSR